MAIGHIFKELPTFQRCKDGTFTSSTSLQACQWHKGVHYGLPPVTFADNDAKHPRLDDVFAVWFDVDKIHTDTARFQNRESDYSEESVQRIINNFDINQLTPVDIWYDPKQKKYFMLSGHSRLEAHRRLGKKRIPVKFFKGSEQEAITFAKVYANRGQSKETLIEDLKAYKLLRDEQKLSKAELYQKFKDYNKLEAYSYLNPQGQFINILNHEARTQYPFIENKAMWAGIARKHYPQLSNQHESEIFDFFFGTKVGLKITRDEFHSLIDKKLNRLDFDYTQALQLTKTGDTGTEARADTSEAQKRIYQIDKDITELQTIAAKVKTREEKSRIQSTILQMLAEKERLAQSINVMLKSQASLFGVVDQHYKVNAIVGYNGEYLQELARELTKPLNTSHLTFDAGYTKDIVSEILQVYRNSYLETKELSRYFAGNDALETVENVWRFVKENIRYVLDPTGVQLIKTPARTIYDDFADCKGYSILKASILQNLGFKTFFRFASYSSLRDVTHIYVVVKEGKKEILCDSCWDAANKEKPYTYKFDRSTI